MELWSTRRIAVANLDLDIRNPRLGEGNSQLAPQQVIQYLFDHDKALEVAESIAQRGYFPNEPVLAIKDGKTYIVVEGNRRLAALKALREPSILDGNVQRKVERLARRIDINAITKIPVTIAPNRKATDQQIAGRHLGTPVLAWRAENRANFILEKIEEGYTNDELKEDLNFSDSDIQQARQTRAIAAMARSLELPDEIQDKLDNPKSSVLSTLERVFRSSVGRDYLRIQPDAENGFVGKTTAKQFKKGFTKLVSDLAEGNQSSRTLNTNKDIAGYFQSLPAEHQIEDKRGSFVPSDITGSDKTKRAASKAPAAKRKARSKERSQTVIPKDFKLRHGNARIVDLHKELRRIKRDEQPNAGAVLLRVFLELSLVDYLTRTGDLDSLVSRLKEKGKAGDIQFGVPKMRHLAQEAIKVAKRELSQNDAKSVEKALRYDASAPFTVADLHSFVHQPNELPGPRDIEQFWVRIEPLMRLMLEDPDGDSGR